MRDILKGTFKYLDRVFPARSILQLAKSLPIKKYPREREREEGWGGGLDRESPPQAVMLGHPSKFKWPRYKAHQEYPDSQATLSLFFTQS